MKIFWFTNVPFTNGSIASTGTWIEAMGNALVKLGKVEILCISQAKVRCIEKHDYGVIKQWLVPYEKLGRDGLPCNQTIRGIQQLVEKEKPDLIHVWGTENYWGLLTARGIVNGPAILDMQGIVSECARVFYGGLTFAERLSCIGPLEIMRPAKSIFLGRRLFERMSVFEKEIIRGHRFISIQSEWVKSHVLAENPQCTIFKKDLVLRKEFTNSPVWKPATKTAKLAPVIFFSSAGSAPYKGFHVLIRAMNILKRKYPHIILKIAGDHLKNGVRRSGYIRWIQRLLKDYRIVDNVRWLGPLDASGILMELHDSSLVVIPSFVESYSLAFAEAMYIGIPVVASNTAALPELGLDEVSALYFQAGNSEDCAGKISRIITEEGLCERLSNSSRELSIRRNNTKFLLDQQTDIYKTVLNKYEI
jgi:glycosyltransferase involved in cell wall biosynthesis